MSTRSMMILIILYIVICCVGCHTGDAENTSDVFDLIEGELESFEVFHYDFEKQITTEYWDYGDSVIEESILKLNSIQGIPVDVLDIDSRTTNAIGLRLNVRKKDTGSYENLYFLIIANRIVDHEGNIHVLDDKDVDIISNLIKANSKDHQTIDFIVNHRSIAFNDNSWDTRFLMESDIISNFENDIEYTSSDKDLFEHYYTVNLKVINKTKTTIEYGSRVFVEAKIDQKWYRIDDLMVNNIVMFYSLVLYKTKAGDTQELGGVDLSLFMPLPVGEYRFVKEFTDGSNTMYANFDFRVTWNGIEYD